MKKSDQIKAKINALKIDLKAALKAEEAAENNQRVEAFKNLLNNPKFKNMSAENLTALVTKLAEEANKQPTQNTNGTEQN